MVFAPLPTNDESSLREVSQLQNRSCKINPTVFSNLTNQSSPTVLFDLESTNKGNNLNTFDNPQGSVIKPIQPINATLSNFTNQLSSNPPSDHMTSYRQLKHLFQVHGATSDNKTDIWMNCFKLISESDEALQQFLYCLNDFLVSQKTVSKRKNSIVHRILHLFLPNLFGNDREDIQVEVQCLLTLSNPQDLIVKIRQLIKCPFIKSTILPSRLELEMINSTLSRDFRSILEPSRTPSGFRVSLVKFVKFVASNVYSKTTLSGLRVDIYGDAMSRGKRDVVRMAFRILDSGIHSEQSSTHVFTFAVFDVSSN